MPSAWSAIRLRARAGSSATRLLQELAHGLGGERLEAQRGPGGHAGRPFRAALGELGPRERADEDRVIGGPVEQLLDEVEQAVVRPLHVLERQHHRVVLGEPLEEQPPTGEQLIAFEPGLRGADERSERLGHAPALVEVGDPLLEPGGEPRRCFGGRRLLGDPEALADHLGERPVRDALAEGQAAARVPPDFPGEPVDVVGELEAEARLAHAGRPGDPDQSCDAPVDGRVEEVLEQAQLRVAADEGTVEAGGPLRARNARDHPLSPVQAQRLGLALHRVLARVLVGDRGRGHLTRDVIHEHGARIGGRLHPRGGVDAVADHQPFTRGGERGDLAGDHPGPCSELRRVDLLAEDVHGLDQLEPRAYGPLGVVLARDRHAPDRHHRVADELLDGAPIASDDRPRPVEVATEQLADVLRVA